MCGMNARCVDGVCQCIPGYEGDPNRGCRPPGKTSIRIDDSCSHCHWELIDTTVFQIPAGAFVVERTQYVVMACATALKVLREIRIGPVTRQVKDNTLNHAMQPHLRSSLTSR